MDDAHALCTMGLLQAGGQVQDDALCDRLARSALAEVIQVCMCKVCARTVCAQGTPLYNQVLTVPELQGLAPLVGCDASGTRDVLLEHLCRAVKSRHMLPEVGVFVYGRYMGQLMVYLAHIYTGACSCACRPWFLCAFGQCFADGPAAC